MPEYVIFIALAAAIPFAATSMRLARAVGGGTRRPVASGCTLIALIMLVTIAFSAQSSSLFALYVGIWAASLAAVGLVGGRSMRSLLAANYAALSFMAACNLIFFGYLMLMSILDPQIIQQFAKPGDLGTRSLFVTGSLVLGTLFELVLARLLQGAYPVSKSADTALRPLGLFLLLAIIYVLLDAIPSALGIWFKLMPFFLLGGTLLLIVFCAVFSYTTARTGAEAFREAENMMLEQQRQDQETRMRLYRRQATVDQLTGLMTRRAGQQRLEELQKAQQPYVVAFIDLDGLKTINDVSGHLAGDAYLSAFGQAIIEGLPDCDLIRWGGDEFLVILKEGPLREEDLRAKLASIEAVAHVDDTAFPVRFSCGITAVDSFDEAPDEVVQRADEAMYEEKLKRRRAKSEQADALEEAGVSERTRTTESTVSAS